MVRVSLFLMVVYNISPGLLRAPILYLCDDLRLCLYYLLTTYCIDLIFAVIHFCLCYFKLYSWKKKKGIRHFVAIII
jgi:hypothetical protein